MRSTTFILPALGIAFFILLQPFRTEAQRQQRFKAGVIAGVTASQIDGDASAGFHKVGLQGGLRGIVVLKPRQEASIEFLYM